MENTTVLIVDDEKFNVELAGAYLKEEGCHVLFALNGEKAIEILYEQKVDLIFLDIKMPGLDGFSVCKKLKEDAEFALIPIIFLTALDDKENIARAFEVGGADYITKPFNPLELKARAKTQLRTIKLMQELQEKQKKLAQLSVLDPFTKLPNALYFESQLNAHLKVQNVWVLLLQISKLETLNRLYGFLKTNKILALFAKLLQHSCYSNVKIARIYGGHFGIIFNDYRLNDVEKNISQIRRSLRQDDTLKKIIEINIVLYYAKKQTPIDRIYVKLQQGFKDTDRAGTNYVLIK